MVQLFNQLLFIHHQAFKDLKRSLQKKITIFITIFISVFILFVISTLNQSLLQEIRSNTKSILGGDAEIEVKNQELNESVLQSIETFADISLNTTIASMVANEYLSPPKTSFVQLRAVDSLYPLYGEFITTKGKVDRDFFENSNLAIINENLAANLQLKEGDTLIIRDQSFTVHSIIQQMPDLGGAGLFALRPGLAVDCSLIISNRSLLENLLAPFISAKTKAFSENVWTSSVEQEKWGLKFINLLKSSFNR